MAQAAGVVRALVLAAVALRMATHLSGAHAQPSAGTTPLVQSLLDMETLSDSLAELAPALPQEALAPATTAAEVVELVRASRERIENLFCTKPAVTNGQTQGTVIRGPQLNITVSGGKCSVAADLGARQKQINCTGPSVSYSKAPITFKGKHSTADVFEDGACVYTKHIGNSTHQREEKVLWSAGDTMRFDSVHAFLAALKAGALDALFGPDAAARVAQQAAAATAVATAAATPRSQPVQTPAAAVPAGAAAKPGSLKALLQGVGWEIKMNTQAATDAAAATEAQRSG